MKVYSWNVNGIRAVINKGAFQKFVAKHQPDILCLQETKASQGQAEVNLPEYHEYMNSAEKKGYSGTAIFTKQKPLKVLYDLPDKYVQASGLASDDYGDANKEGRVLAVEFDDFFVVTAYTPNSKGDLSRLPLRIDWDKAVTAYCAGLQQQKPVLYCGDMNVAHTEEDLANPKANIGKHGFTNDERKGFENWLKAGFLDTFRIFTRGNGHYSWWTHWANARARNVGWRIDYWLVSKVLKEKVKSAQIHSDILGSDHCPVSIEIDL